MSYNGSGTFNINTAGQPVVTGTTISSTAFNALTADLATGLSTAIAKDGQTTATAKVPFALGVTVGAASTYTGLQTFSNGVQLGAGSTLANFTTWAAYTATLTLVGGAGNTVPTYTGQSFSRWQQVGKRVDVDIDLTNSAGGTAGAGTGTLTVALPVAVSASGSAAGTGYVAGVAVNGSVVSLLHGILVAGATTLSLNYSDTIASVAAFTGVMQNNVARKLRLSFSYPVD